MKVTEDYSFSSLCSLRVKDKAAYYCELTSINQIQEILAFSHNKNIPLLFIGEGTNIVPSKSYQGMVVKNKLTGIKQLDGFIVEVASGENWHDFVEWSISRNMFGLENLALIPGSVGAGPIQNIGAYGADISSHIKEIKVLNITEGYVEVLDADSCKFDYRTSIFKERTDLFILSVTFELDRNPLVNYSYDSLKKEIQDKKINEKDLSPKDIFQLVSNIRTRVLPNHLAFPNVGSFFKNIQLKQEEYNDLNLSSDVPIFIKDNIVKIPSAYLIDKAGWKGYREGGIGISDQHALVLIAYEETSGNEILNFAHKIIDDVFSKTKIKLEIEPSVI